VYPTKNGLGIIPNNISQNPPPSIIHLSPTTTQSSLVNATDQEPSPTPIPPTSSSHEQLSPTQGALPLTPVYHTSPALPVPPVVLEHCFKPQNQHTSFESLRAQHIGVDNLFYTNLSKLSDATTKEKIRERKGNLDIVKKLDVYEYKYKQEFGGNGTMDVGFIAQQLQEIDPQLVQRHVCPDTA
jgi:hypothetical protein